MKNIILIFFLCASVLISHAQNNNKACLRELKRDTKKYWYYDKDKNYYVANDTFVRKLAASYYTCLEGMDSTTFCKIFGKPNWMRVKHIGGISFTYSFDPNIIGIDMLIINIDKNGKLTNKIGTDLHSEAHPIY